jgi:hypothetical protein
MVVKMLIVLIWVVTPISVSPPPREKTRIFSYLAYLIPSHGITVWPPPQNKLLVQERRRSLMSF